MKQGKWLVQEIDKAIKSAPQDCGGDEDQRKHWANRAKRAQGAISKICKDWPNQILHPEEYKAYWQKNNPRIRRLTRYVLQSRHKQLEAHGCITIQAPDGPEYTLINTKDALRELKKRVALKYIENDAPPLNPTGYLPKQRTDPASVPTVAKQAPDKTKARKLVSLFAMDEKAALAGFYPIRSHTHCSEAGEIFATDGRAMGCVLGYADGEFDTMHEVPKKKYENNQYHYTGGTEKMPFPDTRRITPGYREASPPDVKQYFNNHATMTIVELFPHVYNCDLIVKDDPLHTTMFFKQGDKLVCAAQCEPSAERCIEHSGLDKYETGRASGIPEFSIQSTYALKAMKLFAGMGCGEFTISWNGSLEPIVFSCERAYAVVMPVRFEGSYEPIKPPPRKRVLPTQE